MTTIALALVSSVVIAVAFVAVWERYFPLQGAAPATATRRASMASEDADVDELLRLIATAEDRLASHHTTTKVVLITDMKSFSTMTEEDGSVATAKAIQRHRDLLIPIIASNGGNGKSTGGDGLVAAFDSATAGLTAAVSMQRALSEHNAEHPGEREIWVRMGLASGEVVLDNGGRPFIGAALNLAARVMNLADGGQIYATGDVAADAERACVRSQSFGDFELKNIARPVEISEILWAADQVARSPKSTELSER
jgi:class 3 adenylate cyclase